MNKKNFWNNGNKIWVWILIIMFALGAISQASIALFKSNQAYESSQKNIPKIAENDKRIEVLKTQLENIEKTVNNIDRKIDRALRR